MTADRFRWLKCGVARRALNVKCTLRALSARSTLRRATAKRSDLERLLVEILLDEAVHEITEYRDQFVLESFRVSEIRNGPDRESE